MTASRPVRAALLSLVLGVLALGPALLPGRALLPADVRGYSVYAGDLGPDAAAEVERANARAVPHRMDRLLQFLPFDVAVAESWRRGELPLWEPGILSGIPLLAQATSRAFYPTALVFAAIDPVAAYAWLYLLHLVIGGTCLYRLARRLGAEESGALLGCAAFTLSGYALAHLHHPMIFYAAVWALPALEAAHALLRPRAGAGGRTARLPVVALALATALSWLAGFPQASVLLGYMVVGLALALAAEDRAAGRALPLSGLARVAAGLALGLGIALVQVLPTLEAQGETSRARAELATASERALAPVHLLELALPGQLAPPGDLTARFPDRGPRPSFLALELLPVDKAAPLSDGVFSHMETALGFGVWPLVFALLSLGGLARGERRAALAFAWGFSLVGLAVACALPGVARAALLLPGFAVGDLKRLLMLPAVCLPLAAALGWRPLRARALVPAAALGAAVLALGVLVLRSDVDAFARAFGERIAARVDVPPEAFLASLLPGEAAANRDLLGRGLCALGLALLFAPLLRAVPRLGSGAGPFVVATAVELLPVALLLTPAPAASSVAAAPSLLAPVLQAGLEREPRARLVRYEPPTAADPGARALADVRLLPPNLTRVFGIPDATGYAPLPSRRSKAFFELVEPGGTSPGTGLACFRRAESLESPLLDLLRVEWVLASGTLESERWNEVATRGDATLYRRTSELPRARLFFRSRRLEPERVAVALQTGLDPLNEAILEPERSPPADLLSEGEGEVFVLKETARRVDLEVTCSAPAILALADAWAPGWKVSVDGAREQESLPVHLFLRGVDLEAGRHHVVFEYTPSPFVLGAALSIASLVLTLLWVLLPDRWLGPLVKSEGVEGNG